MKNIKYYRKKISLLKEIMGGKCVKCHSKDCLEFDHINSKEKSFSVSSKWSYSIQLILAEVSKCQLLCESCHQDKTRDEFGKAKHGTYSMYRHYHCRCQPCRDSFNKARKIWRANAKKRKLGIV